MSKARSTKGNAPTVAAVEASGVPESTHSKGEIHMANTSPEQPIRQITVPFHGAELLLIEHEGQPYTPMRPVVEGMGLAWSPQRRKLVEDRFRATVTELITVARDGRERKVLCMCLRKLPGWLMSVDPGRIKDKEVRARVIQYQNECDDVLWQYWNEGLAINPRMAFSVNPDDVLTGEQQETLRLMVKSFAERLPKDQRAKATITTWSKLKSHFKVPYRQIPQHEFTEAVSIVTRTAAEWVVVDDENVEVANDPLLTSASYRRTAHNTAMEFADACRDGVKTGKVPDWDRSREREIADGVCMSALTANMWLLHFDHDGRAQMTTVPKTSYIVDPKDPENVANFVRHIIGYELLPKIFEAMTARVQDSYKLRHAA